MDPPRFVHPLDNPRIPDPADFGAQTYDPVCYAKGYKMFHETRFLQSLRMIGQVYADNLLCLK